VTDSAQRIALGAPLAVGIGTILCTILIHALALIASIYVVRHERRAGLAGKHFWVDFAIVTATILFALAAHVVEMAIWALVFMACGEFSEFSMAFYHSGVNYTTLGYGDVIMSARWKVLGPLEAADGMLLFGVTTAMIFAVIQRLVYTRFADLRA
jgi:Ion channel